MGNETLYSCYNRLSPAIPELFSMAYAICGNVRLAEYALQVTLTDTWLGERRGGIGFREGLRNRIRREALYALQDTAAEEIETTWDGLTEDHGDPLLSMIVQENAEIRRILALRYGCALSGRKISRITGVAAEQVRESIHRFERRVRRRLSVGERRRLEALVTQKVRHAFSEPDPRMPSMGAIYRVFASDAAEIRRPSHLASRMIRKGIYVLLVLLCAVVFWLSAVLIQPTTLEAATKPPNGTIAALVQDSSGGC